MKKTERAAMKAADREFENHVVRKVTPDAGGGWEITCDNGGSFFVPENSPVKPKPGMKARFYGRGIGAPIRGLDLDGVEVFYRTPGEEKKKHLHWCEAKTREDKATFKRNKKDMDRRMAALPKALQGRIERFRAANPDFRWEFEAYELFCCEEAVKIDAVAQAVAGTPAGRLDWLKTYHDAPVEQQRRMVPAVEYDAHSGNTFGMACALARLMIERPDLVTPMHGALTPLVGCNDYGCRH